MNDHLWRNIFFFSYALKCDFLKFLKSVSLNYDVLDYFCYCVMLVFFDWNESNLFFILLKIMITQVFLMNTTSFATSWILKLSILTKAHMISTHLFLEKASLVSQLSFLNHKNKPKCISVFSGKNSEVFLFS